MRPVPVAIATVLLLSGCSKQPPSAKLRDAGLPALQEVPRVIASAVSAPGDAGTDDDAGADGCGGDELCRVEKAPDTPLAGPCGAVAPSETMFPLRPDAGGPPLDFVGVMRSARAGHPVRLEIEFYNPRMMCECPDFSFRAFNDPEKLDHEVYAVFPRAGPRGHWWGVEHAGPVKYVMTGYFTGRMIDHGEFWREQTGEEQATPSEEGRYYYKERYPEFCVESWCASSDKEGARAALTDPSCWDAKNYWKWIQKMRAERVPFCEEPRRK